MSIYEIGFKINMGKETPSKPSNWKLISRRKVLIGSLGSSLGLGIGLIASEFARAERPDIVMIILDSLRARSLPMYGNPRNIAPFLNRLSKNSSVYEKLLFQRDLDPARGDGLVNRAVAVGSH